MYTLGFIEEIMATPDDFEPSETGPFKLSEEEIAQIRASTQEERAAVQALVLRECTHRWQKVARVIGALLDEFDRAYEHLPYGFIQAVMERLEDLGEIEIAGDVWSMGEAEIRLSRAKSACNEA
jgi:hypothetical protein